MTGPLIGLSVVLGSFFLVNAAAALVVRATSGAFLRCVLAAPPAVASARLLRLRLLPTVAGLALALAVVGPAFFVFEPRDTDERVTLPLALLALSGAGLLAAGLVRVLRQALATRRLLGAWSEKARRVRLEGCRVPAFSVETVFPVVALVGVWRPRLFVSAALLRRLTPAELAAVIGHETGHLRSHDNLKRLALSAAFDVFAWSAWSRRLDEGWLEAAEDAADDHAVGRYARQVDLADALLQVARLSHSLDMDLYPASALYRGERVARRVRRLLEHPGVSAWPSPGSRLVAPGLAFLFAAAAFGFAVSSPSVHAVLEAAVRWLQ